MLNPNLLPASAIRAFQRKRLRGRWFKAAMISFVTALIFISIGQSQANRQLQQIEALRLSASQPRDMQTELQRQMMSYRRLRQIELRQIELRSPYSPLIVLELLHRCKEQLDGKLQVVSLDYTDESDQPSSSASSTSAAAATKTNVASSKAAGGSKSSHGHVQLRLITEGSAHSSAVMQFLQASGYFAEVQLVSPLEKVAAGRFDLQFTVRCTF